MPGAIRRADTDMTTGSIMRHLIAFSVPLLIGNIFQQLYNTVDSVVVGNFVGKQALAAVEASRRSSTCSLVFSRALQPARAF